MSDETNDHHPGKVYKYLTLVSLFLFAMLWSLGSFFVWLFLGLSAAFGILTIYYSGIKLNVFKSPQLPDNPYRAFRQRPDAVTPPPGQFFIAGKIIRMVIIVVGAMIAFLVISGIFTSKQEDASTGSTEISLTEPEGTDEATLYTDKGNAFFSESQYDSALKYYEKVLTANPLNQYALYNKALVFYMKKDYWGSITIVKKCLREQPDYNEALWLLGDNFFTVSYYDSALITLEKAHQNSYSDPGFLQLLADTYLKKNNRPKAIEIYKEVIQQDSSKFEVYRQLAELEPARADWYRKKADAIEQSVK